MKRKEQYRITTPNGIDEKTFVPINEQAQYIFIRGKDIRNPVILALHGGPAGPDAHLTYEFAKEIWDDYTLVSWDQRGCGRTYFKNRGADPDNQTATFQQALRDVDAVVDYLRGRFHKDKVILMGHSYGTILGVSYVSAHPEKVGKYIGIGQSVSIMDTQTENYYEVLNRMKQENKKTDALTNAYEAFKREPGFDNLMRFQRLTTPYFLPPKDSDIKQKDQMKLLLSSPDLSFTDLRWLFGMLRLRKHYARNKQLLDYTLAADIYDVGNHFSVPMYFISGEYDKSCNANLVKTYCGKITAPAKEVVIMKHNGHNPQIHDPAAFAAEVKKLLQHQ